MVVGRGGVVDGGRMNPCQASILMYFKIMNTFQMEMEINQQSRVFSS